MDGVLREQLPQDQLRLLQVIFEPFGQDRGWPVIGCRQILVELVASKWHRLPVCEFGRNLLVAVQIFLADQPGQPTPLGPGQRPGLEPVISACPRQVVEILLETIQALLKR